MQNELQKALLRLDGRDDGEHPSAETLAAFHGKDLRAEEREMVLAHLGRCRMCRECLSISTGVESVRRPARFWKYMGAVAAGLCGVGMAMHFESGAAMKPATPKPAATAVPARSNEMSWRFGGSKAMPLLQKWDEGGKVWKTVALDRNFRVQSLAWNETTAWVRSESGEVRQSRDAGLHWDPLLFAGHKQFADLAIRKDSAEAASVVTVITTAGERWTRVKGTWRAEQSPGR